MKLSISPIAFINPIGQAASCVRARASQAKRRMRLKWKLNNLTLRKNEAPSVFFAQWSLTFQKTNGASVFVKMPCSVKTSAKNRSFFHIKKNSCVSQPASILRTHEAMRLHIHRHRAYKNISIYQCFSHEALSIAHHTAVQCAVHPLNQTQFG